jgi:hypothetical protein
MDAAHAGDDDRAELGIDTRTDQQFRDGRNHRLHEQAGISTARHGLALRQQLAGGLLDFGLGAQVEAHPRR